MIKFIILISSSYNKLTIHLSIESVINQVNSAQEEIASEQNRLKEEIARKNNQLYNDSLLLPWETTDESKAILSQSLMEEILSLSLGKYSKI